MNKSLKLVITIVGVVLLVYGIYTLIAPEASVSIGPLDVQAQDNTNAYITIALGIVAVAVGALIGKKS